MEREKVYQECNKSMKVKSGAAKILKDILKRKNENFEEFNSVKIGRDVRLTWICDDHSYL